MAQRHRIVCIEAANKTEAAAGICRLWLALVTVAVLGIGFVSTPLQAQGPTAVSLNWSDLEAGCEAADLSVIDGQQCRSQLASWRSDYEVPLQQPDLLMPTLDRVLAELPAEVTPDLSLWDRFWTWLREWLGGDSAQVPAWLKDWQLPENFADWLLGLSVGACVLLALGIVGNELWQVYRSRAMAHEPGAQGTGFGTSFAPHLPTLAQVSSYPLQEQPGLLLHIVLNELQQRELVPRQVGRTHQDLLQQAPTLGELGKPLANIAQAAERSTYGDWQVSLQEVEPLLAAGQQLVEPDVASDTDGLDER